MLSFTLKTRQREEFVEITEEVRQCVRTCRLTTGVVVVYCPHTTAGVTIQENADPDVVHDLLLWFQQRIPQHFPGFRHGEGNSDAHLKSSLVGSSVTLIVEGGDLVLGRWQGIYFCEFDGPRTRTVHVQTLGNTE
ncbi:MAG: secondary thiamine-phosphate synthase enzyme YjbQ [Gemmataceae bacterium]|nr:secondary thiamine-phosphate synthase enzyme YjbQ [Gemmata sp.]MDW8196104.1 secondary thiamine-phosphate synthase enzyme YjbQ [Gemmataceae bacterium]